MNNDGKTEKNGKMKIKFFHPMISKKTETL